jgi:hypothetical protein
LPLRNGDGGQEGVLRRRGIGAVALQQELAQGNRAKKIMRR